MSYVTPTISDFKGRFGRDFPFATPVDAPSGVVLPVGTAVTNGSNITAITLTSVGSGLKNGTTKVVIYGGGGVRAKAQLVTAGAIGTGFTVLDQGIGYTKVPNVYIPVPGEGDNTTKSKVTDFDIAQAVTQACAFNITQAIFGSQAAFTEAYDLLSAHYLVESLLASASGINGKAEWITKAKAVANVKEDFDIPDRILRSPYLSKLSKTTYGAQFLELVSPQLIGNVQSFRGQTNP